MSEAKLDRTLKRICVFCGSSPGHAPVYLTAARAFGEVLARNNIGLVYGGASVGLMGAVADAVMANGGEVIGVIPHSLAKKEVAHHGLQDLRIVSSMHERKALMAELSDAFVALPGGIGTLEELFEIWTWAQLGHHGKPVAIYNIAGFYDGLLGFLDGIVEHGFMKDIHRKMLLVTGEADILLSSLRTYSAPETSKWLESPASL